jgi:hypothetical protein
MSSITELQNNNTHTSNIDSKKSDEANTVTPVIEVSSDAEAPVLNIWQLRQQVKDAAEALEKANKLNNDLSKLIESVSPEKLTMNESSSDGFTVYTKKKYTKKPYQKPFHKNAQTTRPTTPTTPTDTLSSEPPKKYVSKHINKNKSSEDYAYRGRRRKALDDAQNIVVAECVDLLKEKKDEINTEIEFTMDYRRKYTLWCTSDDVCVEVEGEKFVFSRFQYLENRYFQRKVRERADALIPSAWINFSPRRDSNCCCIYVQKRKERTAYNTSD